MLTIDVSRDATRDAGLRYVSDTSAGIRRRASGRGFTYVAPDGSTVRDRAEIARIRALAIPPAYRDVWICSSPRGHIQATGRDARGRKQYRYHDEWRTVRDAAKFDRMLGFAAGLPALRKRVTADLKREGLPKERVLAGLVRLLESTLIRIGNEEYARDNKSFGLTTLRMKHVDRTRSGLHFKFRGKSGRFHEISVTDKRLARLVRRCGELPGQYLFQYEADDGTPIAIGSDDVNDYIRDATSEEFSAKDIRTWYATTHCLELLLAQEPPATQVDARRAAADAVKQVAERLGNTVSVCRKCYIHPDVIAMYEEGTLKSRAKFTKTRRRGLSALETATIRALKKPGTKVSMGKLLDT
jgi:DNA topoisomerase I